MKRSVKIGSRLRHANGILESEDEWIERECVKHLAKDKELKRAIENVRYRQADLDLQREIKAKRVGEYCSKKKVLRMYQRAWMRLHRAKRSREKVERDIVELVKAKLASILKDGKGTAMVVRQKHRRVDPATAPRGKKNLLGRVKNRRKKDGEI